MNKKISNESPDGLIVMTYNIQHGYQLDRIKNTLEKIGKNIDIVCLQEMNHFKNKSLVKDIINKSLSQYEGLYYEHPSFGKHVGFATFWKKNKLSLTSSHKMLLPEFKGSSPLHHKLLMSSKDSRRGALIVTFKTQHGKKLRVVNVHLDWRGKPKHRLNQLNYITDFTNTLKKSDFEIICGDFNTIGPLRLLGKKLFKQRQNLILSALGLNYSLTIPDANWTHDGLASFGSELPFYLLKKLLSKVGVHYYQKLDYIFVNGFEVMQSKVLLVKGSDHFPVIAELRARL